MQQNRPRACFALPCRRRAATRARWTTFRRHCTRRTAPSPTRLGQLGLANRALAENVELGPWIHVQSRVRLHAVIAPETKVVVEPRVAECFERPGHEFVDLDVFAFLEPDTPALTVHHRAIYRLRGT